jgi:CBS domain-containing protein
MTTDVVTCQPDTTVEELMSTMTNHRIRHVPVLVDGALAGVVSIGDVVKDRIAGLELETKVLHDYIANPY